MGHLQKVDPDKSGSFDRFAFLWWYVDKEISLDSSDKAKRFVGWVLKVNLMGLQWSGLLTEEETG